jgi:hypothetical protein
MQKKTVTFLFVVVAGLLTVLLLQFRKDPSRLASEVIYSVPYETKHKQTHKPEIDDEVVIEKFARVQSDIEDIQTAILDLEGQLNNEKIIDRLNDNLLDENSRDEAFSKLKKLDNLRAKKLTLILADLDSQVADLEKIHDQRLRAYGVQK